MNESTVVIAAVFLVLGMLVGLAVYYAATADDREQMKWYKDNYLYQGGVSAYNGTDLQFDLVSVDGGKHWAARNKDGSYIGDANKAYPGLLEQLQAWNNLVKHVSQKGPIDPVNDTAGMELLKKAGINVTVQNAKTQ